MNRKPCRTTPGTYLAAALALLACGRGGPSEAPRAVPTPSGSQEVHLATDAIFNGIDFVDAQGGWIVGGSPFVPGGIVGLTVDGGSTWRYKTGVTKGGPTSTLVAVHGFDLAARLRSGRSSLPEGKRGAEEPPGSHLCQPAQKDRPDRAVHRAVPLQKYKGQAGPEPD